MSNALRPLADICTAKRVVVPLVRQSKHTTG